MKGNCSNCNKKVQGIKNRFHLGWCILFGFIGYGLYRVTFCKKNKCPICGLKL